MRNAIAPKPTIDTMNAALDGLSKSRLRFAGGQEPSYQVTLLGLLSSSWGLNALHIIQSTIELLRGEKTRNPSMFRYSWHEIQRACHLAPQGEALAYMALTSAGLGAGWFRNEDGAWLQNPPDLDVIFEHPSALDYVRTLLSPARSSDEPASKSTRLEDQVVVATQPETKKPPATKIFLSHASVDADLAKGLIDLLEAGVETRTGDIRCTSVPGYKLEGGDRAPDVLRQNLEACAVVVGILTKKSVSSPYVLMELGAAWALGKRAIPLVGPGASFGDLPGPFRDVHALHMADESDMAGLCKTIATATSLPETGNPAKIQAALRALTVLVSASGTTASEVSARPPFADEPGAQTAKDLLARRKLSSIEGLAKAADLLTKTILETMGGATGLCPNMLDYTHLVQETRNYYSVDFYNAAMAFYSAAQGAYTQLAGVQQADFVRIPALHGHVEAERHRLTDAMRRELETLSEPPSPLKVELSGASNGEDGFEFVATVKNVGSKQLSNWAAQLEVPATLVNPSEIGTYVKNMSDKRRAVFRTTPSFAAQEPLWPEQTYSFRIRHRMSEEIQGTRGLPVRATAYVDGELKAEHKSTVGDLCSFFLPAVAARREAVKALMTRATHPLGPQATTLSKKEP